MAAKTHLHLGGERLCRTPATGRSAGTAIFGIGLVWPLSRSPPDGFNLTRGPGTARDHRRTSADGDNDGRWSKHGYRDDLGGRRNFPSCVFIAARGDTAE